MVGALQRQSAAIRGGDCRVRKPFSGLSQSS